LSDVIDIESIFSKGFENAFFHGGIIMAGNLQGIAAYQQTAQTWGSASTKKKTSLTATSKTSETNSSSTDSTVKTSAWKPIDTTSSLVPTKTENYGYTIGNVELSEDATKYYNQLKAKYGNMEFICVSKDMKSQVQANAAAYGNSSKMVVLIDDEKLERMATDESYRDKYEAIISLSQSQLEAAKNSLVSSGANLKNFGMSVNSDGTTSFFATLEKSSSEQTKLLEKRQAAKKEQKAKEKKAQEKKENQERLEKTREKRKAEREELEEKLLEGSDQVDETYTEEKEYVEIKANTVEDLVSKVSEFAYANSSNSVMTEAELSVGQNIDFKG